MTKLIVIVISMLLIIVCYEIVHRFHIQKKIKRKIHEMKHLHEGDGLAFYKEPVK